MKKKKLIKQLVKTIFFLTALTIVCGFLVRTLTDSETLSDYAANNPEQAYGHTEVAPTNAENETEISNSDDSEYSDLLPEEIQDLNIEQDSESEEAVVSADRVTYQDGFYYEPLSDEIKAKITGISYPDSETNAADISYDDLRYLSVLHYDFNGEVQMGELICNKEIAEDLVKIFYALYLEEYQIEKIRLIDEYQGDDDASMQDNNTSCFNYRTVPNSSSLSNHAYGCAIDINPFYNPYVTTNKTDGTTNISPSGSEIYADRSVSFEHKIDEDDLCYKLFIEHGFEWGGIWNSQKDYQHFEKDILR
ncbi:MAG: M15 family metallopeptidase [Clostridiales bacterium]|nr:M15 family metallopeptidase [Clostridiales bacterium]